MRKRTALSELLVSDVCRPNSVLPNMIDVDASLPSLLKRLVEGEPLEPGYVVTKSHRLCGTIPVARLMAQLFPLQAMSQNDSPAERTHYSATRVQDIMDLKPRCVSWSTPLGEVARIMLRQNCNRLPVVDERMRLRGEVRDRDLFAHYLQIRGSQDGPEVAEFPVS